jgi:hypothetical protein
MPLHRCLDCNATMKADETACWACGSAAKPKDQSAGLGRGFATFINFFFILSLVVTVASLFTDMMPPFLKCATVTGVLFLVKSSMGQMMEKKKT